MSLMRIQKMVRMTRDSDSTAWLYLFGLFLQGLNFDFADVAGWNKFKDKSILASFISSFLSTWQVKISSAQIVSTLAYDWKVSFLKKLWCCVVGEVKLQNLVSNELMRIKFPCKKVTQVTFWSSAFVLAKGLLFFPNYFGSKKIITWMKRVVLFAHRLLWWSFADS